MAKEIWTVYVTSLQRLELDVCVEAGENACHEALKIGRATDGGEFDMVFEGDWVFEETKRDDFKTWKLELSEQLLKDWDIACDDAGLDDEQLRNWFRGEESVIELSAWFGKKYDLTPMEKIS